MEALGYKLETEKAGTYSFRRSSGLSRALKMGEDRITLSPTAGGVDVEGLTRDLARVVSELEASQERA